MWLRSAAESHEECLDWYQWYLGEFDEIVGAFSQMVDEYLAGGARVCLTCYERHADDCHRGIIAAKWRDAGPNSVKHLAVDGCERLVAT